MPTYKVSPGKGTATGWTFAGKTYLSGSEVELPDKIGEIGVAKGIFSVMEIKAPPVSRGRKPRGQKADEEVE
jgi:hypothetical protein